MLKFLFKKASVKVNPFLRQINKSSFSTAGSKTVSIPPPSKKTENAPKQDIFPDTTIANLKKTLSNKHMTADELNIIETEVIEKLHFYDSDQYCDVIILFSQANRGTEVFWDFISSKIFDYELDIVQTSELAYILEECKKSDYYIMDPLLKNLMLKDVKWKNEVETYEKLLH